MPLPKPFIGIFAVLRMDEWVFMVGIAIPIVCIVGLVLWHVVGSAIASLIAKPKTYRHALEPRPLTAFEKSSASNAREGIAEVEPMDAVARIFPTSKQLKALGENDAEKLQRIAAALENSLAETYLELAESWLRTGQIEQASAAFQKILQSFPQSRQADAARARLRQI